MIKEWSQQELIDNVKAVERSFAVFIYTPFCGTCKLTERMLEIVIAADPAIPINKCNINYLPAIRQEWKITSVPCIVFISKATPPKFLYSMNSVDDLLVKLRDGTK
jgi:thiol-disulfide isomerase/thioredoxin